MDGAQQFFFTVICIGLGLVAVGLLIVSRSVYRRVEAGAAAVISATLFGLGLSAAGLVVLYYVALVMSIK